MKKLINTVINSLKTPSGEQAIVGRGETLQQTQLGSQGECTCAKCVGYTPTIKTNESITENPLWKYQEALQDGMNIPKDFYAEQMASKFSADSAMLKKHEEKMSKEKELGKPKEDKHKCFNNDPKCQGDNAIWGGYCQVCVATITEQVNAVLANKGRKNDSEKPMLAYIPKAALEAEGKAFSYGARKYTSWNYRNGIAIVRTLSASLRHIFQFLSGEDIDPESGVHHLGCARANLGMALDTLENHPEFDDRFKESK